MVNPHKTDFDVTKVTLVDQYGAVISPALAGGTVDVDDSAVSSFDHGRNADIDTAAEQITTTSMPAKKGVLVRADPDNTGILYLGNSDVTAESAAATDGYPLYAGEAVFIEVNDANKIYAIASANNQACFFLVV